MRLRNRLMLLFLFIGLVPLVVMGLVAYRLTHSLATDLLDVSQRPINVYLQRDVQDRVRTLVQQIQQYEANHPEQNLEDRFTLVNNTDLALLTAASIGQRGYSFVYDLDSTIIFHPDRNVVGQLLFTHWSTEPEFWRIISGSLFTADVVEGYYTDNSDGQAHQMYLAAQRVPNTNLWASVVIDVDEFLKGTDIGLGNTQKLLSSINFNLLGPSLLLIVLVVISAVVISGMVSTPVEWMAQTTVQLMHYMETISQESPAQIFKDEIKYLGYAIGLLSKQMRTQVTNLEEKVRDRTNELSRRTNQVELAAQVAREAAEILDVDELLDQTTMLISERFGFYHVGVFLIDQAGEYALLKASNSEGGRRMLARQHKLSIGQGVVGYVADKAEPRIVSEVGSDVIHFKNPDLPYTRSEMALAMRVRGRVIGVLDVQSTDPNAYASEDTRILQVLADQLALAIENARLYNQSQRALNELEVAYGQQAHDGWMRRLENNTLVYTYDRSGVRVSQLPSGIGPETVPFEPQVTLVDDQYHLCVPLLLRNRPLGMVELCRESEQPPWSQEEIEVVRDSVSQIASMLENARLLEEIARRARQESIVGQISSKVQSSLDMEAVLASAVREISLALSASRVEIDLTSVAQMTPSALHATANRS